MTTHAPKDFLRSFAENAIARAELRWAANGRDMLASFYWDAEAGRYIVSVMQHIVACPRSLSEVRQFCAMHNTTRTA